MTRDPFFSFKISSGGTGGRQPPALQGLGGRQPPALQGLGGRQPPVLQGFWGRQPAALLGAVLGLALIAPIVHAGEIWVTNEKDDTISVIDTETLEVTRTLPTGERPRGITFSHDFTRVYICASDSDTVQVMDPATGEILHDLPSGEDPEQFVLHPDNRHLWIANEDDAITTVVDVEERRVVAQIDVGIEPEGMAVSPDGKIAITTSETTSMAHWISTETHQLIANTLVDARPRHAEFTEDQSELWVSSEIGGTITVFDAATQAEKGKVSFSIKGVHPDRIQPVGFEFTADGAYAFVALGPANHLAVVNTKSFEVEDYILVGRRVWHMAFDAEKKRLFTTNGVSGDVTVVDVAARKALKTIKVGRFPWGVALRP
jgi:PQQ-dependent catabolism-associated beta-propeller protein